MPLSQAEAATAKGKAPAVGEAIKTIKTSDYDIVEQLKKQTAQISLFDLIQSSDKHRNTLEKFLAEVHVPAQIEVNALDTFMSTMIASNAITFSDEDLPEMRMDHNNALFITIRCRSVMVPKVLIDGGSGVNIIPAAVAQKLGIDKKDLPASNLVIRAFDGAKRSALGETTLEIAVGPVAFDTAFQILETAGSFNMLLGRPWIHQAGAIPSTIHQMVKFAHNGKLITVRGEYDIPICNEVGLPYLEEPCGDPSTAQAVEIVNMIRRDHAISFIDTGAIKATRYLLKHGYQVGLGLGIHHQGSSWPICDDVKGQRDKKGLGHEEDLPQDYMQSLSYYRQHGFQHAAERFVPSSQGILEQEQLLDKLEDFSVNMIEEAPFPSDVDATEG